MITSESVGRMAFRFGVLAANALLFGIAARRLSSLDMGVWSLTSALTTIVLSLDWGVANFIRNYVVSGQKREQFFSAAILITSSLALAYATIGFLIYFVMSHGSDVTQHLGIALPYLVVAVGLLAFRLPTTVAMNCFFSFEEPGLYNLFEFATMFLSAAVAIGLLIFGAGLGTVLFFFYASGTCVAWLATYFFMRRRHWGIRRVHRQSLQEIFAGARSFGLLQVVSLGLGSLPAFVIGSLVGIEYVTSVRASVIIGQAVLSLHLAHAMPLWTEFSKIKNAVAGVSNLRKLQLRLVREVALLGVIFSILAVASPYAINLWVGKPIASFSLCLGFSLWAWSCGICNLYSLVLNGRGRPSLTMAALVPGNLLMAVSAKPFAGAWGSVGVGASFALGASISAMLMAVLARVEIASLSPSALDV